MIHRYKQGYTDTNKDTQIQTRIHRYQQGYTDTNNDIKKGTGRRTHRYMYCNMGAPSFSNSSAIILNCCPICLGGGGGGRIKG